MDEEDTDYSFTFWLGAICFFTVIGYSFGPEWGWGSFGLTCMLAALWAEWQSRRK